MNLMVEIAQHDSLRYDAPPVDSEDNSSVPLNYMKCKFSEYVTKNDIFCEEIIMT